MRILRPRLRGRKRTNGNLLASIQSAIDFFDLLVGLGRRRMDAAGVCCRYFGLGDDRLYFHLTRLLLHLPLSPMCARDERGTGPHSWFHVGPPTTDFSNPPETRWRPSFIRPPSFFFRMSKLSRKSSSLLSMDGKKKECESQDKRTWTNFWIAVTRIFFFFFCIRSVKQSKSW